MTTLRVYLTLVMPPPNHEAPTPTRGRRITHRLTVTITFPSCFMMGSAHGWGMFSKYVTRICSLPFILRMPPPCGLRVGPNSTPKIGLSRMIWMKIYNINTKSTFDW